MTELTITVRRPTNIRESLLYKSTKRIPMNGTDLAILPIENKDQLSVHFTARSRARAFESYEVFKNAFRSKIFTLTETNSRGKVIEHFNR